jgi:hypothetical protein
MIEIVAFSICHNAIEHAFPQPLSVLIERAEKK